MKWIALVVAGCCFTLLPEAKTQDAATEQPADTAAELRKLVASMRPESFHFGPPFNLPPELTPKVIAARERVVRYTQSHSGSELNLDWFAGVDNSYMHSTITEWNSYPVAEAGLREWWNVLQSSQPEEEHAAANLSLRMASYHLQNWGRTNPQRCLAILAEAEDRFFSAASADEQDGWKWWVARFAEVFQQSIEKITALERPAFLASLQTLLNKSVDDETMPLHSRTFVVTNQARNLYSHGQPERAAAMLDAWWRKHGEKIRTPDFFAVRFFVAYLGQGDRATAKSMVQRATVLVEEGAFSAQDGNYKGMIDAYYSKLVLTDDELKRRAHLFMSEQKQTSPQKGKHTL